MLELRTKTHPLKLREFIFFGCHILFICILGYCLELYEIRISHPKYEDIVSVYHFIPPAFVILTLVLSVSFHEVGHAFFAFLGGDWSVRGYGYLTFDFRKYIHPVLTIIFPLFFYILGGLPIPGGAVHIRFRYIKSFFMRILTHLGGATGNAFFIFILILVKKILALNPDTNSLAFLPYIDFIIYLNVLMILFNLIPLPPLDGFSFILELFPDNVAEALRRTGNQFGFFLVAYLIFIDNPLIHFIWQQTETISLYLGCEMRNIDEGRRLASFLHLQGLHYEDVSNYYNEAVNFFKNIIKNYQ